MSHYENLTAEVAMDAWTKVVTDPLGLAAFALALVFGFLGAYAKKSNPGWMVPFAFGIAGLALVAGIGIAVLKMLQTSTPSTTSSVGNPGAQSGPAPKAGQPAAPTSTLQQTTTGSSSPAVANTKGDVNVNSGTSPVESTVPSAKKVPRHPASPPERAPATGTAPGTTDQRTQGQGSPAVANTRGDVTITVQPPAER